MTSPQLVHVPTPGDHYSPATGSAPMTIIYELAREHQRRGGTTVVVVAVGTRHDYPVGRAVEVPFAALPGRRQRAVDALRGRAGLERRTTAAAYAPCLQAISPAFDGTIFVHNAPAAARMLATNRTAARVVLYAHNDLFRTYGRREAARVVAPLHRIVCVSEYVARGLRRILGDRDRQIAVVHNGVDVERFRPTPRDTQVPVILFVGRVVPEKGAHLVIEAAKHIAAPSRPFVVRIVGSSGFSSTDPLTDYERRLRASATCLGGRVEFQPFVDRNAIVEEYSNASIFCTPSVWDEPCSLTLPEGMASGLPVVASSRGGMPELGGDAVQWFEPPDVRQLASHLVGLLDSEPTRGLWGARARARAEGFSWSHQYEKLSSAMFD